MQIQLDYDYYLVAFSGGKDSMAALLHLLEMGVPREKIEVWHHEIDGRHTDPPFPGPKRLKMDWACTPSYCRKISEALNLKFYASWREGGFEREMLRDQCPTAKTWFETPDGLRCAGGKGKPNTRLKFPQVSADLSVRWCSFYLKIGCMEIGINNQDRFKNGKRTLVISGERAEESASRAKYKTFEPHRTDTRKDHDPGVVPRLYVDHWRPVHDWTEEQVWEIIKRWRINAHPCYRLGFGRCSCLACIFGSANQWASVKAIAPEVFSTVGGYENRFGLTINRKASVDVLAAKGQAYAATTQNPAVVLEAMSEDWPGPVFLENWTLPAGAFGEKTGPT